MKRPLISLLLWVASCGAPDWYGPSSSNASTLSLSLCRHSEVSTSIAFGRVVSAAYPSQLIEVNGVGGRNLFEFTDVDVDISHGIAGEIPGQVIIGDKVSNRGDAWLGKLWLDERRDIDSLLFFLSHYDLPPVLTGVFHPDEEGYFRFPSDDYEVAPDAQGNRWEVVAEGDLEATILNYRNSGVPCGRRAIQEVDGGSSLDGGG